MTKMPDTDPTPKPDRDPDQDRVIQLKKDAQKRSEAGPPDSDTAEALDTFVNKEIEDDGA
jgi:hypothetical protein